MNFRLLVTVMLFFTSILQVAAEEITVAVASNFTSAMKGLVLEFERASGHQVKLVFGSSGKFYAQIKNGAPFQAFFSADQAKPQALEKEGLAVPGSRFTYAIGTLVLWSSKADFVDDKGLVLSKNIFNKLALANPQLAPYGAAALEVLQNLKVAESTQEKWVRGENIAQTYQFVGTGNADLGFVALSQIMDKGHIRGGSVWIVPRDLYSPIRQGAVLLARGENSQAARELLEFVRSAKVEAQLEAYGYHSAQP